MKTLLALILTSLVFLPLQAAEKPKCVPEDAAKVSNGKVLCCCQTVNGQCCNYVSFCSGYIPGCFCSPGKTPEKS